MITVCGMLGVGLILLTASASGQDKKDLAPDFMKFANPGPEHKLLGGLVGTWKTKVKFYTAPGKPPQESTGTMTAKWVLGDRFVAQHYKGEAMGQPFEGLGLLGYDIRKKEYTATWADSMTTAVMTSHGKYDAAKKTFTFQDEVYDPYVGKKVKTRDVWQIVDKDTQLQKMYRRTPEATEDFLVLEIQYKREK
jgi:hypothetical protein